METNPMKILHIIDSGGLYGAEKALLTLVSEQIKLGLQPEIASIGVKTIEEKPIEREARRLGLPFSKFRMMSGPNFVGAIKILYYARKTKFDLLHSHGYKGNILFGFIPQKARKLPLVSTVHGYTNTGGINKMRFYEWMDRIALSFMEAVVLVSETMKNNPKLMNVKRTDFRVIQNCIPSDNNRKEPTNSSQNYQLAKFCEHSYIIGAVGRLSHEKGFDHLIEAFKIFSKKASNAKLIVLGEGRMRESLEKKIICLELENKVLMPGYVENAAQFMKLFDVFVLSSITEGLPITLLEAMQTGLPVVSTKAGGVVNVLRNEQTGLLVNHSDPPALADALERIYHDENLRLTLGREAKREVLKKYSSQQIAQKYLKIYQEVLHNRNKDKSLKK